MLVPGSTNPLFLKEQLGLKAIDIPKTVQFFRPNARLTRTPVQSGSRVKFTAAMWVKRGKIGIGTYGLLAAGEFESAGYTALEFIDDHLVFTCKGQFTGGEDSCSTAGIYVDTSAFYQIVLVVNTGLNDPTKRIQIYVNGVLQDIIDPVDNEIQQDTQTLFNNQGVEMMVGASRQKPFLDEKAYNIAEATIGLVYLLDNKNEGINRFGKYDSDGVWRNKLYDGSYGKNGAKLLDFSNGLAIGKDANSINDFFPHNLPETNEGNGNWVSEIVTSGGPKNAEFSPIRNAFAGENAKGGSGINTTSVWTTNIVFTNKFEVIINGDSTTSPVRFYWGNDPNDYYDYSPFVGVPTKEDITSNVESPITKVEWTTSDNSGPFFRGFFADEVQLIDNAYNRKVITSDSPTDGFKFTDTGKGNQFASNYAVYNPTNVDLKDNGSFKKGNREVILVPGTRCMARGSFPITSGKWWWEVQYIGGKSGTMGISDSTKLASEVTGLEHNLVFRAEDGKIQGNLGRAAGSPSTFGPDVQLEMFDRIGFALDMDNGNLAIYKNNLLLGDANTSSLLGKSVIPHLGHTNADSQNYETITLFGAQEHRDQAPSGYKSLATAHVVMTFPNGRKAFDLRQWIGFKGVGENEIPYNLTPTLVWIKPRQKGNWYEVDRLRGTSKVLFINSTGHEQDNIIRIGTRGISEFTDKGFKLGNLPANGLCNNNDVEYMGYAWDMGKQENENTDGDITSKTLVHQAAGLSLITYEGNGLRNQRVGHGLNTPPTVFWTKCTEGSRNVWALWSSNLVDYDGTGGVKRLYFNSNQRSEVRANMYSTLVGDPVDLSCIYVDHTPENDELSNNIDKRTHLACCFTPVKNFSSFGTFVTGASNQNFPFIMLDFSPSFIITKNQERDEKWIVVDNSRPGYNEDSTILRLDVSNDEEENSPIIHFLSNGFQLTGRPNVSPKVEGDVYFYMAFAANPFFSNGGISR